MPSTRRSARRQTSETPASPQPLNVLNHIPVVIYQCTAGGDVSTVFISEALSAQLGYTAFEVLATRDFWIRNVHAEDVARLRQSFLQPKSSDCREYRFRHKTGEYRLVREELRRLGGTLGTPCEILGWWSDSPAERTRADERFRLAVDAAPNAMVMVNQEGSIVLVNSQTEQLFGYRREELIGQPVEILVPKPFRRSHPGFRKSFFANPGARPMGAGRDLYGARKDGSMFPVEIGLNPIETEEGTWVLSAIVDITERKRAQERFRLAVDAAPNAMVMVNQEGHIVLVNSQTEQLFGYRREELIGQPVEILVPVGSRASHPSHRKSFLSSPRVRPMGAGRELYGLRKDGTEFPVEIGLNPIETEEGTWVLSAIVDITERKRAYEAQKKLEAESQHAQKLESLGVLAGGIAHDFNNLLVSVMGYAGLALMELAPESPTRSYVQMIETAAQRASELTKQLLDYSGKGRFVVQPIDLSRLVNEMSDLLKVSVSKKVVLTTRLPDNLPAIEADAAQMQQVVMNLITNASEALGDKAGTITVSTGVVDADRKYLSETYLAGELPEGSYVYLEVSDTGIGMDEETKGRIFDPFFTTKFAGRGLGLAAVLGIVRSQHGAIRVYSKRGHGTTFRVLFPSSEKPALEAEQKGEGAQVWSGSGTILVVDDEDGVRLVAQRILEKAGFSVLTARDGLSGLETFRKHSAEISLVLLDMTMPLMSGDEVFRKIRRIRSNALVVLSSGYNEQEATRLFAGKGLAGFIQKPYPPNQLIAKLREVLDH